MTNRLTLGVDPGHTGAIVALADGVPSDFLDIPTVDRKTSGRCVDGASLARQLRNVLGKHPGAYVVAIIERVGAMPGEGGTGAFNFGQADGIVRGVLAALGIPTTNVEPRSWKGRFGLLKQPKSAGRPKAVELYPTAALWIKNSGRADALLIARWGDATDQSPALLPG